MIVDQDAYDEATSKVGGAKGPAYAVDGSALRALRDSRFDLEAAQVVELLVRTVFGPNHTLSARKQRSVESRSGKASALPPPQVAG